mmetsp:Transcript_15225/g.36151  ORF Transcript_15225/g.36151 Transcript_15225/m.36151 type:complete len:223 (+) Transcript_15225:660-1328(+)
MSDPSDLPARLARAATAVPLVARANKVLKGTPARWALAVLAEFPARPERTAVPGQADPLEPKDLPVHPVLAAAWAVLAPLALVVLLDRLDFPATLALPAPLALWASRRAWPCTGDPGSTSSARGGSSSTRSSASPAPRSPTSTPSTRPLSPSPCTPTSSPSPPSSPPHPPSPSQTRASAACWASSSSATRSLSEGPRRRSTGSTWCLELRSSRPLPRVPPRR